MAIIVESALTLGLAVAVTLTVERYRRQHGPWVPLSTLLDDDQPREYVGRHRHG